MGKVQPQTLKGFRDFLPEEVRKRQYVIDTLKKVFELFGFEPLETPALEYEDILLGKYGEEGDQLMYRFQDLGGRRVALRYDQTVPLARVVAQYQNILPMPFKRYQIQPVWRAENTQKGRFREFFQCDIDIVGANNSLADAEIIMVAARGLEKLGFKGRFKILINDRNVFNGIGKGAITVIDKLKKIGREGVVAELVEKGLAESNEDANKLLNKIENSAPTDRLDEIFGCLKIFGISEGEYVFSPTLARGLNYYTSTIFEIEVEGYPAGSICGGGRYDELLGLFGNSSLPAIGCAFGFDRIIEAMDELNLFPKDLTTTKVLVTIFSPTLTYKSEEICSQLRASGINTEIYLDPTVKIEKQLKYADTKGIPYVVLVGPDEIANNTITIKNLKTRGQKTVARSEVLQEIK